MLGDAYTPLLDDMRNALAVDDQPKGEVSGRYFTGSEAVTWVVEHEGCRRVDAVALLRSFQETDRIFSKSGPASVLLQDSPAFYTFDPPPRVRCARVCVNIERTDEALIWGFSPLPRLLLTGHC